MPYADINGLHLYYPDRVRRADVASADHRNDRGGEALPARLPTPDDFQAMRDAYAATAPDPGAFDAVAQKTSGLVQSFMGCTDDQLRDVQVPVLIMVGCHRGVPRVTQHRTDRDL
ncbi:MAG: hypothetical protein JO345_30385 [Streptosporangiaceae bacterium]|nr:hypothetical protein [Streptosporangiaceae bacterium]